MSTVDHYGSQYSNFASSLYATIREKTFDTDIGQNGWQTSDEQDLFLSWLELDSGSELLDVACGSGGPTLRIAEESGCSVTGIDIHSDGIAAANSEAGRRGLAGRSTFIVGDGSAELPFDDASFDGIMCIDAINHLPDRPKVITEWARLLKPGGRMLFTDPIIVTGPLTNEEMTIRSSIGYFLFVPDGYDDKLLDANGLSLLHRENRTPNMALMAERWKDSRAEFEDDLIEIEGEDNYRGQQVFFEVCARLAREGRLSRIAYCAQKRS
ncbi:MAG: methyltransferase domain-containing protein [Rhodothermales bacterium]|nr:methyltransferase domain-containing protein [Rhodothermales bacterium]